MSGLAAHTRHDLHDTSEDIGAYLDAQSVPRSYAMARRHDATRRTRLDGRIVHCVTLDSLTRREMTAKVAAMAQALPDWRVWSYDCERED